MMAQFAEFERELVRERVVAGMAKAKKRGRHVGRRHTLRPISAWRRPWDCGGRSAGSRYHGFADGANPD